MQQRLPWPADAVERRPVATLVPYARNARTHSPTQIDQIAASINEWGWTVPILIGEDNGIIAGHGRVLAAHKLGLADVPVMVARGWTKAQHRAYVLADNKLTLNGGWDDEALRLELGDLKLDGFDLNLTGFSGDELAGLLDTTEGLTDPDDVPDAPAEPVTVLGDVWVMGRHRLVCGDSTTTGAVDAALAGVRAQMVLTDPPYGMHLDTDFSGAKGSLKSAGRKSGTRGKKYDPVIGDNEDFVPALIETVFESFSDAAELFLFGADYYAELLPDKNNGSWLVWDKRKEGQSEAFGSEFELIWSKRRHKRRMLRHDWFGFLSSSNPQEARARVHPTQKPSSLLVDIIKQWGQSDGPIADPYLGSGTTIIAAEMTGRACHAIELSPAYCDVAVLRWQAFTGQTATNEATGANFAPIKAPNEQPQAQANR